LLIRVFYGKTLKIFSKINVMHRAPFLLLSGVAMLIAGCVEPGPNTNRTSSPAPVVVGTVVGVEDGQLSLRLANGEVENFMLPSNESILPPVLLSQDWRNPAAWKAHGRRCKISIKESRMEVGGGGTWIPVREITSFEWL